MPAQLALVDGFDTYTDLVQITRRWSHALSGSYMALVSPGRFGVGRYMHHNYWSVSANFNNEASAQAFRLSFAIQALDAAFAGGGTVAGIRDGTTFQVGIGFDAFNRLVVHRNNNVQIGQSNKVMQIKVWNHVEMYVVISDSIGANQCVVRVNGEEWVNVPAGTSTRGTTNNSGNNFCLNAPVGTTPRMAYDDVVVWFEDITTTPTWVGDNRVQVLYPNGNGSSSQFVGSDGNSTDNYLLVDDPTINDADYVGSSVVGNKDIYPLSDLASTTTSVKGVQVRGQVYNSDAGSRTGKLLTKISSTEYEGPELFPPTSAAMNASITYDNNPATSAAWTIGAVNALEIGIKVQS